MTPDVNILVAAAASRHPHHETAHAWLDDAVNGRLGKPGISILPIVGCGFLRVVTNPRVFKKPTPITEALEFLKELLALPNVVILPLGPEWPILESLCARHSLRGNDISDAWVAAAILHYDEHLGTLDRGFERFLGRRHVTILRPPT